MAVPKLRFRAEDGSEFPEWENERFGNFFTEENNVTAEINKYPLYSLTIESGVIPKTERYERRYLVKKDEAYKIVPPKAFVYNPMNLRFGALAYNKESFAVAVSGYYNVFRLNNESTLDFWANYLITKQMLNYYNSIATGSLVEKLRVHFSRFKKIEKQLPTIKEQQKIADFLSTIDAIISSQKEELAAWEQRKKGVVQKLFSQEVRFKADDGSEFPEWEEKRLRELTKKVDRKAKEDSTADIRMISQGNGFILQSEKYSRDNTGESIKKYTLLRKGEFAYNHGASKQKPFGVCYCLNEGGEARVPFVYHTFKIVEGCTDYFNYALNLPSIDRQLKRIVSSGARMDGLLNIRYDSYMSIKINIPSLPEQQKIADCLSSIDEMIKKEKEELEKWQELKKGLLQQMFV